MSGIVFLLQYVHNLGTQLIAELRVILKQLDGAGAALTKLSAIVAEPAAALLNDVVLYAKVKDFSHLVDAFTLGDFEFGLTEWWGHLVLHYFHAHHVADGGITVLYSRCLADVDAHAGIEFQCITARCCLRTTEHHTNLLAELLAEDAAGVSYDVS